MLIPWGLTTVISHEEEWNAGVVLAVLAFTVVFIILSILAASIKLTSKILGYRERAISKKKIMKRVPEKPKPAGKPLTTLTLAEVAAAVASLHRSLEIAAAVAAVHHHGLMHKVVTPYLAPQALPTLNPWVISWLNEASYRFEVNPYFKEVSPYARNIRGGG